MDKYYDEYDIMPSNFVYKHYKDRSQNNFYLISDGRHQLHRERYVNMMYSKKTPETYDVPLLNELCYLHDARYMSQRMKRMSNLYQIELRCMRKSKYESATSSTFEKHVRYSIWDNRDIFNYLVPAQRMCFFR